MKSIAFVIGFFFLVSSAHGDVQKTSMDFLEFNNDGSFLDCTLSNGQHLVATDSLVILGTEILAKSMSQAFLTTSSEQIHYQDHGFEVVVYKQFCGREGLQGVSIKNLYSSQINNFLCKTRNICSYEQN